MRFSYAEAMTNSDFYLPLAQAAEEAGYHSMTVADSICYPRQSSSPYPYTADGGREFLEDKPFPETLILIAAMGAVTSRLRFTPFVLKLPVRPPVLVAKQVASLACLTNNRIGLGVGISPWREDFEVMGVPFGKRGKRMDETIDILRGLTGGGYFDYDGEIFDVPEIKMDPVPTEPIPILVGGHSDAALRRAAVRGDGWMHAGGDPDALDLLLNKLHRFREQAGTTDRPFAIHAISSDAYTLDEIKRLEDKGVTDVIVAFRNLYSDEADTQTLDTKIASLRSYAESIVARAA
jgi:probable F420-dependent oxidoreductase